MKFNWTIVLKNGCRIGCALPETMDVLDVLYIVKSEVQGVDHIEKGWEV